MSAVFVKEVAGVVADAELKFTPQGKAVCKVRLAFSDNIYDEQAQQWTSKNQFYVEGTAWERTAEKLAEVAVKGSQVLVWGKLATDQWEDKQTGEKRSKPAMRVMGFRPIGKMPDSSQSQPQTGFGGGQQTQAPQQSWDTPQGQPDAWSGGNSGESPPF